MTDGQLSKLVYLLDYAASFFARLQATFEPGTEENTCSRALQKRMDRKLFDIFHYDLKERGEFFPELSKQLQVHFSKDTDNSAASFPRGVPIAIERLKKGELHFYEILRDCQQRLTDTLT